MAELELPLKTIWPPMPYSLGSWYFYLQHGFKQLGIPIEVTERQGVIYRNTGQPVIPIDIVYKGDTKRVWYDAVDFPREGYDVMVKGDDLYFKIMMTKEHREKYPRMRPIGQVCGGLGFLGMLPALRRERNRVYDVVGIFRTTNYGLRVKAVQLVKSQSWRSLVWVENFRNRPPAPSEITRRKMSPREHLMAQSRSKLCLALAGVGGQWTWRHNEIWGMGRCCVTTESDYILPDSPSGHCIEAKRDLSDLIPLIDYYLRHDKEREEIAFKGCKYYDEYLTPRAQAEYILKEIEEDSQ